MNFDDKMQEIQKAFTEERVKKFAIMSPALMEQPDYIRSLYLRMLCLLVRGGDMPTEEQVLFVRRLVAGAGLKDDFTELMRQSMNMDEEGIASFIEAFSQSDLKCYFVVDGCIACTLGSGRDRFKLLAECAELLGVTKADLQYLSKAAKAIILQSTEAYDEVRKCQTPQVGISLFYHAKWFYNGALENTNECFHWYSANKEKLDLSKCNLKARSVIIENATIDLASNNLYFYESKRVAFRNCIITAEKAKDNSSIDISGIKRLEISGCTMRGFKGYWLFQVQGVEADAEIIVRNNIFRDCCIQYPLIHEWDSFMQGIKTAIIVGNCVVNCETIDSDTVLTGIRMCEKLQVIGNSFVDCRGAKYGVSIGYTGKLKEKDIRDNRLSGSVTKICNVGV